MIFGDSSYDELLTATVEVDTANFEAAMKLADMSVAAFLRAATGSDAGTLRLYRGESASSDPIMGFKSQGLIPGDETFFFTKSASEASGFSMGGKIYYLDLLKSQAADFLAPGGSYLVPGSLAAGSKLMRTNSQVGRSMVVGAVQGMEVFANRVMVSSLAETPEESGTLRDSHNVEKPRRSGRKIRITMGYGYGDEPSPVDGRRASQYAVPVHEIRDATHMPPTKDHFLLDPLMEHASEFGAGVAAFMKLKAEGRSTAIIGGSGRSVTLTGVPSHPTSVPTFGGGVASRGGNPLNTGQFSRKQP